MKDFGINLRVEDMWSQGNGKYNSNRVIIKEGYASIKWGGDVEGFIPPEGVMVPRG